MSQSFVTTRKLVLADKAKLETNFDDGIEAFVLESIVENNATLSLLDLCCAVVRPKFVVVVVVVISIAVASVIVVAPSVVFSVAIVSSDLVVISEDPNCVVDPKTLVSEVLDTVLLVTGNNAAL